MRSFLENDNWLRCVVSASLQAPGILYEMREINPSIVSKEKKSWHSTQTNLSRFCHLRYEMDSTCLVKAIRQLLIFLLTMEWWKWFNPSYVMFDRHSIAIYFLHILTSIHITLHECAPEFECSTTPSNRIEKSN